MTLSTHELARQYTSQLVPALNQLIEDFMNNPSAYRNVGVQLSEGTTVALALHQDKAVVLRDQYDIALAELRKAQEELHSLKQVLIAVSKPDWKTWFDKMEQRNK